MNVTEDNLYDVRIQILPDDKMYNSHHGLGGREPLTLTTEVGHCRGGSGADIRGVATGLGTFLEESECS